MEELKMLIEMVANLPQMALWVLVGFFAYKVIVVGSIYGVVRLAITSLHSWASTPRTQIVTKEFRTMVNDFCITHDGTHEELANEFRRLVGKGLGIHSNYIHGASVRWLREAIDAKIADDAAKAQAKKSA